MRVKHEQVAEKKLGALNPGDVFATTGDDSRPYMVIAATPQTVVSSISAVRLVDGAVYAFTPSIDVYHYPNATLTLGAPDHHGEVE